MPFRWLPGKYPFSVKRDAKVKTLLEELSFEILHDNIPSIMDSQEITSTFGLLRVIHVRKELTYLQSKEVCAHQPEILNTDIFAVLASLKNGPYQLPPGMNQLVVWSMNPLSHTVVEKDRHQKFTQLLLPTVVLSNDRKKIFLTLHDINVSFRSNTGIIVHNDYSR